MKKQNEHKDARILGALAQIDDDLIAEAAAPVRRIPRGRVALVAACLTLVGLTVMFFVWTMTRFTSPPEEPNGSANESESTPSVAITPPEEEMGSDIQLCPPSNEKTYRFITYSELYDALYTTDAPVFLELHADMDLPSYGEVYNRTLSDFFARKLDLLIPLHEGTPLPISDHIEWQRVTLFTNEQYHLPWIWYYCEYEGETVVISLSYLDPLQNKTISDAQTFTDALRLLAPTASPGESTTITMAHGTTVPVNIFSTATKRTYYRFLYHDCLVSVWAYDNTYSIPKSFWQGFSLQPFHPV